MTVPRAGVRDETTRDSRWNNQHSYDEFLIWSDQFQSRVVAKGRLD